MGFVVIGAVLAYTAAGIVFWMGAGWLWTIATLLVVGSGSAAGLAVLSVMRTRKRIFRHDGRYDETSIRSVVRQSIN